MSLKKKILRSLATSVGSGIVFGVFFVVVRSDLSIRDLPATFAVSCTYSTLIGVPATVVFSTLWPRVLHLRRVTRWLLMLAIGLALTLVGSFAACLLALAIGALDAGSFWPSLVFGLEVATMIGLMGSIGAFAYEMLQTRVEDTKAELSKKEAQRQHALRLAADARLASLESRIRPHFLFNALNSVLALIPDDAERAEVVLERVASLLRFSLKADPLGLAPLREEMTITRDYLEIERVRVGERLRYELDVPGELDALMIPPFSVQTLVENSVKYAVVPRREGAAIRVTAARSGDVLSIQVSDDGPGFSAASIIKGHGLENLRDRLSTLFGERATLAIEGGLGRATVVLAMPAREAA